MPETERNSNSLGEKTKSFVFKHQASLTVGMIGVPAGAFEISKGEPVMGVFVAGIGVAAGIAFEAGERRLQARREKSAEQRRKFSKK